MSGIYVDDYCREVEETCRRAITTIDPNLPPSITDGITAASEEVMHAVTQLLIAAGCEGLTDHICDAEIIDGILNSIPWDEVAAARAEREGYDTFTGTDGLDVYHPAA